MKRVLLLGDSIRMGYQQRVVEGLKGQAEVVAPEENGRFAKYTLWGVNLWIKELGIPDIVHWNNGLWDFHHESPMEEALTSIDEYIHTLDRIVKELRRTGAAVIFATTTPISPNGIGRNNEEIDEYNEAAKRLMTARGVDINDLNSVVKRDLDACISDDTLHLSELGYDVCSKEVIKAISKYL